MIAPKFGKTLPWLALALLAALSTWASMALHQPLPSAAKRNEGIDHAFIQPNARLFDKTGAVAYDIQGAQLTHHAQNGDHVLEQAKMHVYPADQRDKIQPAPLANAEYWLIEAERARVMADREHVQLEGRVDATRHGVPAQNRITLHAQDVTLTHSNQMAQSALPIRIEGLNWQSQSNAFHANFAFEQFEQTGRVHDRYQPSKP